MTALCGGGPSAAKADFNRVLYIAPAALGAFLNNIPTVWAVALAAFIGAVTYDASQFCLSDPPALPTISASDVADLLNPINVPAYISARQKFQDLIFYYLWFEACQCTSTTTPAPAAPPSAPVGIPIINPPTITPSYPTGNPCMALTYNYHLVAPNIAPPAAPIVPIPAGSTHVAIQTNDTFVFPPGYGGWQINLNCFNASGTFIGNPVFPSHNSTGSHFNFDPTALPSGTVSVRALISVTSIPTDGDVHADIQLYCGAPTSGIEPQPCPADPFTVGLLDQILALVTLIQRQVAPFAYVASTSHAGLTGSGHLDVQGLIGCRVTITTYPSTVGIDSGEPDTTWNAGYINWGDSSGYSARQWINTSPLELFPPAAGLYTRIGYSLGPGVAVTITEIRREA